MSRQAQLRLRNRKQQNKLYVIQLNRRQILLPQ